MTDRFIITGGSGFLGKAIGRKLVDGGADVISIARGDYPELKELGIKSVRADISKDTNILGQYFQGAKAVFHTAAKVDMWGPYEDFFKTNVLGSRQILKLCQKNGVSRLIFTSSPSVIANGHDLNGVNEDYPYPEHYDAFYPMTKAQAEQEILEANGKEGVYTCALRPHLIWGPGDTNLLPTILNRAKAGRLLQVGNGENLVDLSYIEDCVSAHLLAMERLDANSEVAGKPFFISQDEPVKMWDWINEVLKRNQLPSLNRKVSRRLARIIAIVSEAAAKLSLTKEPLLTRFLVDEMATNHYFDISRAKTLLNYQPRFSISEAMEKTFPAPKGA